MQKGEKKLLSTSHDGCTLLGWFPILSSEGVLCLVNVSESLLISYYVIFRVQAA